MEQLNELVELAQQLEAAMDDAKSIISANIGSDGRFSFLVEIQYMFRNFDNVDVIKKEDMDYPFRLETEIEGIGFCTHVRLDKVELLRGFIPDEWIEEVKKQNEVRKIRSLRRTDILEIKKAD